MYVRVRVRVRPGVFGRQGRSLLPCAAVSARQQRAPAVHAVGPECLASGPDPFASNRPLSPGLLQAANASGASYLFQPDKLHGDKDIGDKSLQCGRKSDALKIW